MDRHRERGLSSSGGGYHKGDNSMKITRKGAPANHNTFSIPPIRKWIDEHAFSRSGNLVIDPFARTSKLAHITNDLNPAFDTDYNLDALDFLRIFSDESVDVVLFDPPYSLRQLKECYNGIGHDLTSHESRYFFSDMRTEIARVLKPGGICLSFGWSTGGIGKKRNMKITDILIVPHGGNHYDTLCTKEVKELKE